MVFGAEVGTGLGRGRGRPEVGSEANRVSPLPAWVSGSLFLSSDRPRLGARKVGTDPTPPGGPRANSPSRGGSPRPRPLPPGRASLPPNGSGEREVTDFCGAPPKWPRRPSSGRGRPALREVAGGMATVSELDSNSVQFLAPTPTPRCEVCGRRTQGSRYPATPLGAPGSWPAF